MSLKRNDFAAIARALPGAVDEAVEETTDAVIDHWKPRTRVLTGAHRDSIHKERRGEGDYAAVADSDHSLWVETGTRSMRGDHAGVDALTQEGQATRVAERLKRAIEGRV